MHRSLFPATAVLLVALTVPQTRASHWGHGRWWVDFTGEGSGDREIIAADTSMSDEGLIFGEEGRGHGAFLITPAFAPARAHGPPSNAHVGVFVGATERVEGETLRVSVRHSTDREHWSEWLVLRSTPPRCDRCPAYLSGGEFGWSFGDDVLRHHTATRFDGHITIPESEREPFQQQGRAWRATNPLWPYNSDAFCRWAARREPDLFARFIPRIGYLQAMVEGTEFTETITIQQIGVVCSWLGSGAPVHASQDFPNSREVYQQARRPWDFRLSEVLAETASAE